MKNYVSLESHPPPFFLCTTQQASKQASNYPSKPLPSFVFFFFFAPLLHAVLNNPSFI